MSLRSRQGGLSTVDQQGSQIHIVALADAQQWHRSCIQSQCLETIPGVGPLTATALATSIADAHRFKNGRQLAAWPGRVPRQHSSGVQADIA